MFRSKKIPTKNASNGASRIVQCRRVLLPKQLASKRTIACFSFSSLSLSPCLLHHFQATSTEPSFLRTSWIGTIQRNSQYMRSNSYIIQRNKSSNATPQVYPAQILGIKEESPLVKSIQILVHRSPGFVFRYKPGQWIDFVVKNPEMIPRFGRNVAGFGIQSFPPPSLPQKKGFSADQAKKKFFNN